MPHAAAVHLAGQPDQRLVATQQRIDVRES